MYEVFRQHFRMNFVSEMLESLGLSLGSKQPRSGESYLRRNTSRRLNSFRKWLFVSGLVGLVTLVTAMKSFNSGTFRFAGWTLGIPLGV